MSSLSYWKYLHLLRSCKQAILRHKGGKKNKTEYFHVWYLQLKKTTIRFYLLWQSHINLIPTMKLFSYFQFQRAIEKYFH